MGSRSRESTSASGGIAGWLPESLLYVVAKYSDLWGTALGASLQQWMYQNRRPLLWADGDDSAMLIDPTVGQLALPINQTAAHAFSSFWSRPPCGSPPTSGCLTFDQLADTTDLTLHFKLPDYRERAICAPHEKAGAAEQVMGTNARGECVYWVYSQPPLRWECLNDGTCAQSLGGRGTFSSQTDCERNCGQGKWACMQNAVLPGCAGEKATMCVPSAQGFCTNVTECEHACSLP